MAQLEEIATRLKDARLRLESARDHLKQVAAEQVGGPDGSYAYDQAIKRENAALRDVAQLLREYKDWVLGKRSFLHTTSECAECQLLIAVLKTENQVLTHIHREETTAAMKNDAQAFEALSPHVQRVRMRRDAAAQALKRHVAQHLA